MGITKALATIAPAFGHVGTIAAGASALLNTGRQIRDYGHSQPQGGFQTSAPPPMPSAGGQSASGRIREQMALIEAKGNQDRQTMILAHQLKQSPTDSHVASTGPGWVAERFNANLPDWSPKYNVRAVESGYNRLKRDLPLYPDFGHPRTHWRSFKRFIRPKRRYRGGFGPMP